MPRTGEEIDQELLTLCIVRDLAQLLLVDGDQQEAYKGLLEDFVEAHEVELTPVLDLVRTFAKLSGPANAELFTAETANKAFKTVRVKRAVPVLTAKEESFLDGISSSGNFTLEKALKRHEKKNAP
jgi:hypothetical protein